MSTTVESVNWRFVEVGRVVILTDKAARDHKAVIVEIIDHKRVLVVDLKSSRREAVSVGRLVLTPHVIPNLPRGARVPTVTKKVASSKFDEVWNKSAWAKKIEKENKRSALSDFDRFRVMVLKKQKRYAVHKAAAKA